MRFVGEKEGECFKRFDVEKDGVETARLNLMRYFVPLVVQARL